MLKIICNGDLFPAAVEGRSKDEEEVRGVRKEVKRLLEQLRMEIKEDHIAVEEITMTVCVCRQRARRRKTSWETSK